MREKKCVNSLETINFQNSFQIRLAKINLDNQFLFARFNFQFARIINNLRFHVQTQSVRRSKKNFLSIFRFARSDL